MDMKSFRIDKVKVGSIHCSLTVDIYLRIKQKFTNKDSELKIAEGGFSDQILFHAFTIYFKLADIACGNKLENSDNGQKTGNFHYSCRLQIVLKNCDLWQGKRKRQK